MRPVVPREIRLTTGYFECTKRIERLKRFQNLLRHREKWAHQFNFAPPLSRLIPELSKPVPDAERSDILGNLSPEQINAMREPVLIDREINRLIPMVHAYLNAVYIDTIYTHTSRLREFDESQGRPVNRDTARDFDAVLDYFNLNETPGFERSRQLEFELLIGLAERGIGMYEARRQVAKHEMVNPLTWIAAVLRAPLFVLERAGFDESPGAVQSVVVQAYAWFVRLLIVIVLVLAATKLGISIPWEQIAAFFR
jgi:hypothetical protein